MDLHSVLFVTAAFGLNSYADGLKAPDFTLAAPKPGRIEAVAPEGHHFNTDAPMYLELSGKRLKPKTATEKKVSFAELPQGKVLVTLYLCDDQKTFCESHRVSALYDGAALTDVASAPSRMAEAGPGSAPAHAGEIDPNGFILNDAEAALKLAKRDKKPLVIDFFGIWCPPCNQLDEHVFSSAEFKRAASRFVLLKLDADAPASWKLKGKYKIGGYPTVVFADSSGEEIHRVVGARPREIFVKEMEGAYARRDDAYPSLLKKAKKGDKTASGRLGQIHLERREYEQAIRFLKADPSKAEEQAMAEIGLYEETKQEEKLISALESAVLRFPKSPFSVDWRLKAADIFAEKKDTIRQNFLLAGAIEAAQALIAKPEELERTELTAADLWVAIAGAREKLGESGDAKKAWAQAVKEYRKRKPQPTERGVNLELAYCLWKSGEEGDAEEIYKRLELAYPEEFTFYYQHASMKLALKEDLDEGTQLARQALKSSYGDNQLRAAHLLARLLKAQGKKTEALAIIQQTLKQAEVPKDQTIRTHRYVKSLKDLEKEVSGA